MNEFTLVDGQVLPGAATSCGATTWCGATRIYTHYAMWGDNIVWGDNDNIVWSDSLRALTQATNIVWSDSVDWLDNIVWGDNIVWSDNDNIVWSDNDNIVWSDNAAWGSLKNLLFGDNIVWSDNDNIVWSDNDNIVWSDSVSSSASSRRGAKHHGYPHACHAPLERVRNNHRNDQPARDSVAGRRLQLAGAAAGAGQPRSGAPPAETVGRGIALHAADDRRGGALHHAAADHPGGFEQFITWAIDRQRQGKVAFFAVTLRGSDTPVGLFQLRGLDATFTTAEWGFALGSPYWGTGLFPQGAALTLDFAFETLGVERLEARSMVANARGNAALRKVGATPEGLLRQSFEKAGRRHDQYPLVDSGAGVA